MNRDRPENDGSPIARNEYRVIDESGLRSCAGMIEWHILTGEYPPQPGGVSDYTRLVARGLAKSGDIVHVWSTPCSGSAPTDDGVKVHRLPDHFGPRSSSVLSRAFNSATRPKRILVQYVPHAFGWKALNLPFCLWLWSRKRKDCIWVMFHEVHFPISRTQSATHNLLGHLTRLMASLVARASERTFVSIPAWRNMLNQVVPNLASSTWLPVPSVIPHVEGADTVDELRARYSLPADVSIIGHFGTYSAHTAEKLKTLLPLLLRDKKDRVILLLGRGSEEFVVELESLYPEMNGRVFATGTLDAADVSQHLSVCDVMVQPFVDGVSTRRTSVMVGLAHGLPIVTTTGALTEPLWNDGAVVIASSEDASAQASAVEQLLANDDERRKLGAAALKFYDEHFDVRHTIAALRDGD